MKGVEVVIFEEFEESFYEIEVVVVEEEAVIVVIVIGFLEFDLDYDFVIESDFGSEDEFW